MANHSMFDVDELWTPKFEIRPEHKIATFGSCFAQHIGAALAERSFSWHDGEPAPYRFSSANRKKFNYGVFSARTGNIYTTSLLAQWLRWTQGRRSPAEHWETSGRHYDPFRPAIEPDGFESPEEMLRSRKLAVNALRGVTKDCDVFVFTLGLTESWFNREHGYEYPMCPGTVAGEFDATLHEFRNQRFQGVLDSLELSLSMLRAANPKVQVLLTVSPVPLTATNSGRHVLTATMESKSILRAVAGQCAETHAFVDYFPSYELISSPVFRGTFFEPNQRTVTAVGVKFVMDSFFRALGRQSGVPVRPSQSPRKDGQTDAEKKADDLACEEELLSAFAGAP